MHSIKRHSARLAAIAAAVFAARLVAGLQAVDAATSTESQVLPSSAIGALDRPSGEAEH